MTTYFSSPETDRTSKKQELAGLLAPQIAAYAGDFDEWLRNEDPDTVQFAYELIQSMAPAWQWPLSMDRVEHRLEAFWVDTYRDMAKEYAQSAAWDRESGFSNYADRRGV